MCFALQRRAFFQQLNFQKWFKTGVFCIFLTLLHIFWLLHVLRSKATSIFSTSRLTKVFRTCSVCNMLTSKCASHHNGVYFLTAQLPKVLQRHAFFSTSHSPEVLQTWGAFHILTSKSASHDSCVFFLISHATRWLRTQQADFSPFRSVSSFAPFLPFLSFSFSCEPFSSLTARPTVAASVHKSEVWLPNGKLFI